ncbi:carboxylating nicotinate-nucleotide diphosphorylase [Microbacterium excoecariae]|uniref:carboxylating nicotinate-nucleotide diphosphorylase n=1 Tax=Microbacterium excoecariae TaxID=2715210 RepID=UPI0030B8C39E
MIAQGLVDDIVARALREDAPWGDLTAAAFLPEPSTATADLVAREAGVFSGGDAFRAAFALTDPAIRVFEVAAEGTPFQPGDVLARVAGPARSVLQAERVGINLAQRLSGVATLTARFVAAVAGTGVRIADTRKTTPGLRVLERAAVRAGGGANHRFSLSDAVMVKDNHLAVLTASGASLTEALRAGISRLPHTAHVVVEVDGLGQIEPVLAAGVDTILLDNFSLPDLRAGVRQVAGRAQVEASGGVTLRRVAEIAATGVDVISVGALTHSATAIDLGLDVRVA